MILASHINRWIKIRPFGSLNHSRLAMVLGAERLQVLAGG
jgi:hypothetical protein